MVIMLSYYSPEEEFTMCICLQANNLERHPALYKGIN